jgi:hypothetical protein
LSGIEDTRKYMYLEPGGNAQVYINVHTFQIYSYCNVYFTVLNSYILQNKVYFCKINHT